MAERDEIISEQEELLEERDSIINKQEGHIVGLKTEMEENDKYLNELVDGKGEVCVNTFLMDFKRIQVKAFVLREGRYEEYNCIYLFSSLL